MADPHELLAVALDAALAAGLLLLRRSHEARVVETKSTRTDMVTDMDRASEALVAATDTAAMQATAGYYTKEVIPALPYPRAPMFKDSLAVLATRNEAAKGYNLNKLLDPSFVKSADSRGLGR